MGASALMESCSKLIWKKDVNNVAVRLKKPQLSDPSYAVLAYCAPNNLTTAAAPPSLSTRGRQ